MLILSMIKLTMRSFKNKVENVQYRACNAITGAIQGASRERLYRELGLESLTDRRWIQKLVFFFIKL